jgi:hypothetical protein
MMISCSVSYSTLTASVQSHCFNNNNIDPAAKNQNAVIFNTLKKADSPHYLRLLLADWPRCGTKVATTHCWLQTKRTDSYAELSSRSARICRCKSTYITFRYNEEIKFLYGGCVLKENAAIEGLSRFLQQPAVSSANCPSLTAGICRCRSTHTKLYCTTMVIRTVLLACLIEARKWNTRL